MFRIKIGNRDFPLTTIFDRYIRAIVAAFIVEKYMKFIKRRATEQVVFFGHSLDGNLMAFCHYLAENDPSFRRVLMVDNPTLFRQLKKQSGSLPVDKIVSSQTVSGLLTVAKSSAIITSHGPISLRKWQFLPLAKRPLLVDVGHGIGFKGKIATGIKKMVDFDRHFVSSEISKDFVAESGIPRENISVTGYARTDELVGLRMSKNERRELLEKYDISPNEPRKIALYAPTWNEKDSDDIFPFDTASDTFFKKMNQFAKDNDTLILFRPHINTNWEIAAKYSRNLRIISARRYPLAEPLLKITDVLITDWSSIFAEYLALKRPILFIDKEPSFGTYIAPLTLDDRPGAVLSTFDNFLQTLTLAIKNPKKYLSLYEDKITATTNHAWSDTLDGKSSQRYYQQLMKLLDKKS